jgi:hypothetical protein
VQILWWLAPPVAATALAMLWVSWLGREGRGAVDPEVAARRLGRAMSRPSRVTARPAPTRSAVPGERSSGIAVRSSSRPGSRPHEAAHPGQDATPSTTQEAGREPAPEAGAAAERESTRRAS